MSKRIKKSLKQRQKISSTPVTPPGEGSNILTPVFCFKYFSSNCSKDSQQQLLMKIIDLSKVTWQEIQNAPREGLGHESIEIKQTRIKMPNDFQDKGVTRFLVFRANKKARIYGIRHERIFHVIEIDENHTAYK